ncbi:AraC family transcriptional regulator [Paucibacter sp. APW11]|uniref:AraC family transcriptional regulator n=1 Tax=Roseateles aquae TaxID=3077235 RepID=A0ABU3P6W7_9BURK|nr:AraC family transcriptional regulator [Paucibacter sp. APW11]MDT8998290.1 AraC family transcriptional regulator [Paucibacter sp. APW11]
MAAGLRAVPAQPAAESAAKAPWLGELQLGDDWALWRGRIGDNRWHRHFAAQALLDTSGAAVSVLDQHGRALPGHGLIEPLQRHRLHAADHGVLLFVEPRPWSALSLPAPWRQALQGVLAARTLGDGDTGAADKSSFWARWQAGATARADLGWEAGMRALLDASLAEGVLRLPALARRFGLSDDRFRHLFAERMGLPFSRFVLWRRLHRAFRFLQDGERVTQAAHAAGFADAAHFGRTLRHNFGVSATQLLCPRLAPP